MRRLLSLLVLSPTIALGAERLRPPLCLTSQTADTQREQQLVRAPLAHAQLVGTAQLDVTAIAPRPVRVLLDAGWHLEPLAFTGGGLGVGFGGRM